MCLLIFAHRVAPEYPLVLAANRDEFYGRPAAVSDFWDAHPQLLAGRDLQQGGTWMGITRQGRFAAVTNYRDPARTASAPRSRGELCVNFLTGELDAAKFLGNLAPASAEYAGFNLLHGDGHDMWYFSNSGSPRRTGFTPLPPGIYGLSNAQLDTAWPKSELGKQRLQVLLQEGQMSHDRLTDVVADKASADSAGLRQAGLTGAMDELLSAQFIVTDNYGTRCSTTLWTTRSGEVNWLERCFDSAGQEFARQEKTFSCEPPGRGLV